MANDVHISGVAGVEALLKSAGAAAPVVIARSLTRIGQRVRDEAKRNAPRSPTMAQLSATLKRKKRTARRTTPGGLEKSIEYEVQGDRCSVFVSRNSFAGKYAARIHDERNKTWWDRGPGTIAKGQQAREKFIERAITDNQDKFLSIIESEIGKAIQ